VLPSSSEEPCTESLGPAIVDTVAAVAFGTLAFVERNSVDANNNPDVLSRGVAVGFAIGAVVDTVSAVYGYANAARCQRYKSLFHPSP
jgi:hypothetical protein